MKVKEVSQTVWKTWIIVWISTSLGRVKRISKQGKISKIIRNNPHSIWDTNHFFFRSKEAG
jgi:hypothetical protein